MNLLLKILILLLAGAGHLFSKDTSRNVTLAGSVPFKSETDSGTETILDSTLSNALSQKDFSVTVSSSDRGAGLKAAQNNNSLYYIETYYQRSKERKILTVYALLYDPKTGNLVDVIRYTNDITESLGEEFRKFEDKYKEDEKKSFRSFQRQFHFLFYLIRPKLKSGKTYTTIFFRARSEKRFSSVSQKKTRQESPRKFSVSWVMMRL